MTRTRKEYLKAMISRPINLQQPLKELLARANQEHASGVENIDLLADTFHQYFKVYKRPDPKDKKNKTDRKVITQLFKESQPRRSRSRAQSSRPLSSSSERGLRVVRKEAKLPVMRRSSSGKASSKGNKSHVEVKFIFHF